MIRKKVTIAVLSSKKITECDYFQQNCIRASNKIAIIEYMDVSERVAQQMKVI